MTLDFETGLALLALAVLADRLLGDLPGAWHPVAWIARAVEECREHLLHGSEWRQMLAGAGLAFGLPYLAARLSYEALEAVAGQPWLQMALALFLFKATFAFRAIGDAALRVQALLEADRVDEARAALADVSRRDRSDRNREELTSAAIGAIAENASASFVAPLFYFAVLGIPGAVFYRVVRTMDSMIGHRGVWEWAGKATARLDDALNWIPARLTAALFLLAGWWRRIDWREGRGVWSRDAAKTGSPNAGRPMAAMAGLLGVRLIHGEGGGMGLEKRPLHPEAISRAWKIAEPACWAGCVVTLVLLGTIHG